MTSGPITSWKLELEKVEVVTKCIFLSSKITVGSDCSHEIKTPAPFSESYDEPRKCIKNVSDI